MTTYTDEQARQHLDALLSQARKDGQARIRAKDGLEYAILPIKAGKSPFDIPGVDAGLSAEEIVGFVREGRAR